MNKIALLLLLSSPAYAKEHRHTDVDGRPMMRQMYASVWKAAIMDMFAHAGPTTVKLVKNTLVITNPNCNDPDVKTALAETFAQVKPKMEEIDMKVQCVTNALAMN